eukprot:6478708-Amphidinium_carterae.1
MGGCEDISDAQKFREGSSLWRLDLVWFSVELLGPACVILIVQHMCVCVPQPIAAEELREASRFRQGYLFARKVLGACSLC